MERNKLRKIISIITAVALMVCSLGISGAVFAQDGTDFDLQSYVDESGITATNATTQDKLLTSLKGITLPTGYSVEGISEFYLVKAVDGAIDVSTAYAIADEDRVMVPGHEGTASAIVEINGPDGKQNEVITVKVEPTMVEYTFASVSQESDFTIENGVLTAYKDTAEKIVIPEGVTEIKDWIFQNSKARAVIFPESLTTVNTYLLASSYNLEVCYIGNNVTSTLNGFFRYCYSLKQVHLPEILTRIGDRAFEKTYNLFDLYIPESVTAIADNAFLNSFVKEITVSENIASIGDWCIWSMSNLNGFNCSTAIQNTVNAYIKAKTDAGVPTYTTLTILNPNVTYTSNAISSGAYVRSVVAGTAVDEVIDMSLTEAVARIKPEIDKINGNKFEDAESIINDITSALGGLSSISIEWKSDEWTENLNRVENTLLISKNGVTAEIDMFMLTSVIDLGPYVSAAGIKVSNSTTKESLLESLKRMDLPKDYSIDSIEEFYILKAIDGAVDVSTGYKVSAADKVIIPGRKGYLAAVAVLTTPNGVEKSTFVLDIEPRMVEYTFDGCSTKSEFTVNSNGELVSYNGSAEKIIVPEGVKTIAWDAFSSVKNSVRAVILPESLTGLSTALQGCINLELVYMGDNVTTVSNNAFEKCYSLRNIKLSEKLTAISEAMFRYAYNLFDIHIPDSVTEIKHNAFIRSGLRNVVLSENVVSVGDWAFTWMFKDRSSEDSNSPIDSSVKQKVYNYIDDSNMASVPLNIVVLNPETVFGTGNFGGDSRFIQIMVKAVENSVAYSIAPASRRVNLDTVSLTEAAARAQQRAEKVNGMTVVGTDELKNILTSAYGSGTGITAEWKTRFWEKNGELWENSLVLSKDYKLVEIDIQANIIPQDVQSVLNACELELTKTTTEAEFVALVDKALPGGYTVETVVEFFKINPIDGAVDAADREILVEGHNGSIAATIEVMGPDGKLTTATVVKSIPATMAELSFNSVSKPEDFEIEDGVLKKYSGNAEKVVIPEGVTTLASDWLSGIESKKDNYDATDNTIRCIVYPASLTGSIPGQKNLAALEAVSFKGDNVTELGEWAFFKATSLKYVDLPSGLKTISKYALASGVNGADVKLTELYLPEGLEVIADNAFYWNSADWSQRARQGFVEITIPASVKSIGTNAFAWPLKSAQRPTFTVTLLGKDTECNSAFSYESNGANVVIRTSKDSPAYSRYSSRNGISVVDLDAMTLTEAAARASVRIDELEKGYYKSDITANDISELIVSAYGSASGFSYGWGNSWDASIDGKRSATYTLTKGDISFDVAMMLNTEPTYDLDDLVEAVEAAMENNEFTNSITQSGLKSVIDGDMPGGYKVEITEYTLRRAVDGAKDNTGVLVAGYNGSVAAIVKVTDYYGNTAEVAVESEVVPVLEYYTFSSVSKRSDFLISDDGKTLIEYYGTAEKVVIPEGVEMINAMWMWGDPACVKALVLPESLKALPRNLGKAMKSLEVVSMYDNVVNVGENTFNECYSLKYIRLSENLEEISANMFSYTYSLFDLRIPDSVVYIGNAAFLRSSVRDITVSGNVEEVGEYAINFVAKDASSLGNAYFPIDNATKNMIYDWVNANSYREGQLVPCTVTFLSKNTKVDSTNFGSGDSIYAKISVRAEKNSSAYEVGMNRLEKNSNSSAADVLWSIEVLDMSLTEAVARANVAAGLLTLYNGDNDKSVKSYIEGSYVSSAVSKDVNWSTALKLTKASGNKAGKATGTLKVSSADGRFAFDVAIDSTVLAERPLGLAGGDLGDFWGDDVWDDELPDDETASNEPQTPVVQPDEDTDTVDSETQEFPWIWVIVGGCAVVVIAAGVIVAILLAKKKKSKS